MNKEQPTCYANKGQNYELKTSRSSLYRTLLVGDAQQRRVERNGCSKPSNQLSAWSSSHAFIVEQERERKTETFLPASLLLDQYDD
jgi:hypothetical protein